MTDDQITELARLLPPEAAPDLPADRLQILKEHLMLEYQRTAGTSRPVPPRRRIRRPLIAALGAGAVLTAVAATAIALVVSGGQPAPASPAAVELLAKVANVAARQPAPVVSNGEFMYIRSEVAYDSYSSPTVNGDGQVPAMQPLHERQIWLPVANICDWGLVIQGGQRLSMAEPPSVGPSGAECGRGNLNDPTYRLLQSLPTDPRALLHLVDAFNQARPLPQGEPSEIAADLITIGSLIRETILPPATAAALYRAAALIPGVTLIGHVTDVEGRSGIAIAWTDRQDRYEWIFDPATLQFLGERDYDLSTGTPVVTGNAAIMQRAFVGKAGQLP